MKEITLIIPDTHLKHNRAERIINAVGADKIIFIGDYFDDYGDDPNQISETCEWFLDSINKPNRIHLIGNHDIHYMFNNSRLRCSGYEQWKYILINDIIPAKEWNKLKWYHVLDKQWLLSHAGLDKNHLPNEIAKLHEDRPKFINSVTSYLDEQIQAATKNIHISLKHWIVECGISRGGSATSGGLIWCDYDDEFTPIKGLNQIVGHTAQNTPPRWNVRHGNESFIKQHLEFTPTLELINDTSATVNICLDVYKNMHYAVWNGTSLKIHRYYDL